MKVSEFLAEWEWQRAEGGRPDPEVRVIVGHASYDVHCAPFDGVNLDLRLDPQSRHVAVYPRPYNLLTSELACLDSWWHRLVHWLVWRCAPWAMRI